MIGVSAQRAKYDNVNIYKNLANDLPPIWGSQSEVQQVFLNFINNAIDAMAHDGGTLTISSHHKENYLVIAVSDTGEGIPEANLNRIFDPFFTTKAPGKGTGLGLSVSFTIIEGLGGSIKAEPNENGGTCMTIMLPLAENATEN